MVTNQKKQNKYNLKRKSSVIDKNVLIEEGGLFMHLIVNIFPLALQPKNQRYEKYAFDMLLRDIAEEEENIDNELFQKYFKFTKPSSTLKVKNVEDKDKSNYFVNIFESDLEDLINLKSINLKSLLQLGMMNLVYLMDHILFQTFKIILSTSLKNMRVYQIIPL